MAKQAKHTPGPWRARLVVNQMDDPGSTIATIGPRLPNGRQWMIFADTSHGDPEADAKLMAAAPMLLEALEAVEVADAVDSKFFCPYCGSEQGRRVDDWTPPMKHGAHCKLAAALAAARGDQR